MKTQGPISAASAMAGGFHRGSHLSRITIAVWIGILGCTALAHAESLPAHLRLQLGPVDTVQLEARVTPHDTRIMVRRGAQSSTLSIPGSFQVIGAQVLANSAVPAARLTLTGERRVDVLLVVRNGRPALPWWGFVDLRGDPGERTASLLETEDRTGDGVVDIVVGSIHEGLSLCGARPVLMSPRALDPASGTFRPVALRPIGLDVQADHGTAEPLEDRFPEAPLLPSFVPRGASSALGRRDDPGALAIPTALADGRAETAWIEGRVGAGLGELVVGQVSSPPIRAIAFVPPPHGRLPRSFVLSNGIASVRVAVETTGQRSVFVPSHALDWSCLAVVLDESGGADDENVGFGEIEIYSDVDQQGVEGLVSMLVRDDPDARRATELLPRLGERAMSALDRTWSDRRLSERGRLRVVRIASSMREGAALLERAASDAEPEIHREAIAALVRRRDFERVCRIAAQPSEAGDDAARRLLDVDTSCAPALLQEALERSPERPALRALLAKSLPVDHDLAAWIAPASVRISAALGLAERSHPAALPLLVRSVADASSFEDRYRAALAATHLADLAREELLHWLQGASVRAEEWMIRDAAVRALMRAGTPLPEGSGLHDPYPRVRLSALGSASASELREIVRADAWPMVRAGALERIDVPGEIVDALERDPAPMVRATAIRRLAELGTKQAVGAVAARLADAEEWPLVQDEALTWVERMCAVEASNAVLDVLRRGARPNAWERHRTLAVRALSIALSLGGRAAENARDLAALDPERFSPVLGRTPAACR